jgi:hypothetical protein
VERDPRAIERRQDGVDGRPDCVVKRHGAPSDADRRMDKRHIAATAKAPGKEKREARPLRVGGDDQGKLGPRQTANERVNVSRVAMDHKDENAQKLAKFLGGARVTFARSSEKNDPSCPEEWIGMLGTRSKKPGNGGLDGQYGEGPRSGTGPCSDRGARTGSGAIARSVGTDSRSAVSDRAT